MKRIEIVGADVLLYAKACRQRLREIKEMQDQLREEEEHLRNQLDIIDGRKTVQQPSTWREKLNAYATEHNQPFTYHQAADYLKVQGWDNGLDDAKLRGSVAATLARLASNGDYKKITLKNGTNYGLPEWFDGDELKKDRMQ